MQSRTIIKNKEEDFEVLQPQANQQQESELPKVSSFAFNYNLGCQTEKGSIIMDFVIEEETYIILDAVQRDKVCSQSEWKQLIKRKTEQRNSKKQKQYMLALSKKVTKSRVSYIERNTIIEIRAQDIQKRKELWSIANKQHEQNDKQLFNNECLSVFLPESEEEALAKGVVKIHKIFKSIMKEASKNYTYYNQFQPFWAKHLKRLKQSEDQLMKWVENTLYRCAFDFKQIRYCKGLEYLCLGIIFAYPEVNYTKYTQIFTHFLRQLQFQQLYLQGSPRFYCQLRKITESLKQQNHAIFQKISQLNGDTKNLFITYYRSCLLYRLKNPELIRKIFQLLFAQGMTLIKTILLRIIQKMRTNLMQGDNFLQNIASFLIVHYFRQATNEDLNQRLKWLFEM